MNTPRTIQDVIDFSSHQAEAEHSTIDALLRVNGIMHPASKPMHTTTINHYTDPSEQFFSGIWESSVGAKVVNYTEEEFCYLLEGSVRLTDSNGNFAEFHAGNAFTIPAGFQGTWETLTPLKKLYVIWQASA